MTKTVRIGSRSVGEGEPCFIIAEAGSNHDGSLDQAKRLIDVAVQAGADAVKFQLFRAGKLYNKAAGKSDYLKLDKPIYDIIEDMEMPYEWIPELAEYSQRKDIIFLCSVFDEDSLEQLDPYVSAYKIASYEMTHIPLVRNIAKKGKPVIISTGAANLEEVAGTVEAFLNTGNKDLMLMQCTACYPAPVASLNLRAIPTMHKVFDVPVGASDHSQDPLVGPLAAVAVGANLIEKHYTLSKQLPGPDHAFSLEPEELIQMVHKIRDLEQALGTGEKVVQPEEMELRAFARRSIFATADIAPGELITPENVAVLRCGQLKPGLEPKHYDEMIGKTASQSVTAGRPILELDYA